MIDPHLITIYNLARTEQIDPVKLWIVIGQYTITGSVISRRTAEQRRMSKRSSESPGDALTVNAEAAQIVSESRQQTGLEGATEYLQLADGEITQNSVAIGTPRDFRVNPDQISTWRILS